MYKDLIENRIKRVYYQIFYPIYRVYYLIFYTIHGVYYLIHLDLGHFINLKH